MNSCANINTSNSNDTTTLDNISRGIENVAIADNAVEVSYDTSGTRSEEMNNKKCTSCEQNIEHKTNDVGADDNATGTNDYMVLKEAVDSLDISKTGGEICASCGKEGASNTCNKCNMVKYCNAVCKKKHRSKHKKQCERRVEELRDEELFKKQPPLIENDCPICFLRLPLLDNGKRYYSCCGKTICCGCIHAMGADMRKLCPFCRTPASVSDEESNRRMQKRVDIGDAEAMSNFGFYYDGGVLGLRQDYTKAFELWEQAAELGNVTSYYNIGNAYMYGRGVERDGKKAIHYYELAATKGDVNARHNLGWHECRKSIETFHDCRGSWGCSSFREYPKALLIWNGDKR